jgi:hypothetical protein
MGDLLVPILERLATLTVTTTFTIARFSASILRKMKKSLLSPLQNMPAFYTLLALNHAEC